MKAAIIGAGAEAVHTIRKAKEQGLTIIALDGNEKAEGLKEADIAKVIDISKEKDTIEYLEGENVDFLLTAPIGRYLSTMGAANEQLGLPGIGRYETLLCTDKLLFHNILAKEGLRNVNCYSLPGEAKDIYKLYDELWNDKDSVSFPALLKPRFGSGSRGIFFLESWDDLKENLEKCIGEDYLLEEYVEGEEYGIDGAIIDDQFHLILLRHKKNTPLPYRQAVAYFSVAENDPFYQEVFSFMKKVTSLLGLQECLFHADIVSGKNGIFVIELSARPSGHNLHNTFTPLCTGIDMAEEYIKYRMGKECNFNPLYTKKMMIHYFDMEGLVNYVPTGEEILIFTEGRLKKWECHLLKGQNLVSVTNGHTLMSRGYFILEGQDETELLELAGKIKKLIVY